MFVVDTNILVYAANEDSPAHALCREQLDRWRRQSSAWYLTWGILYEFVRVVSHSSALARPFDLSEAQAFLDSLLASPGLGVLAETSRHWQVFTEVFREVPNLSGNLVFDAHTAILMREHGIRTIYTRDTHFHRFPFLEVRDPLAPGR